MKTKKFFLTCLLAPCLSSIAYSQNAIERIRQDVFVLAADSLKGRSAGSEYADKAAQYIISQYKESGLEPQVQYSNNNKTEKNIYCIIEGSDSILKNEFIILGAHYDHLGFKVNGKGDTIVYNGADDNASGSALVLELARKINESRLQFKRSVVIVSFDAEETGLFGSQYFANSNVMHNEVPIVSNTKMMMSLDMVGWLKQSGKVTIAGVGCLKDYMQYFNNLSLGDYEVNLKEFDKSIFTGSDHDSFLNKGIPAFHVSTGLKSPYHKPEDDAYLIDYEGISSLSDYIYALTKNLANVETLAPSGIKANAIPLSYWGFELGYGNNRHYYNRGRMTGKTSFAFNAGLFGRISLNNWFGIKTGAIYNYLGANRYEAKTIYHSLSIPALAVFKMSLMDNDFDYAFNLGLFYDYVFASKANNHRNYLDKNVLGCQFELEIRLRHVVLGFSSKYGFTDMLKRSPDGKTRQTTGIFKIGYVF
jgi:hypothetical protein